jgi:prepilin-type N-terminal cleavage/methylation domain-containing protein
MYSRRSHLQPMRGMSLIEVLVVVAVIGILGAIALPSFDSARDKYRLKAAAEALYGDLQFARANAIKSSATVNLSMTTSCWGMNTSVACSCSTANSCLLKQTKLTEFPGVSMSSSATASAIDGVRGLVTGGAFTVTFTSALGKNAQVSLSVLGRAVLCSSGTSASAHLPDYPAC